MVELRAPVNTLSFIDHYCAVYRDLFVDVRSFEAFKYLHLGMISDLPRKSLPAIARAVGLSSDQVLHHCLTQKMGFKPRPSRAAFPALEYTASRPQ